MALIDSIMAAVNPVARQQTNNFGAVVTVVRAAAVKVRNTSGQVQPTFTNDSVLVNVRAFVLQPDQARKQRIFGMTSTCKLVLSIPKQVAGLVTFAQGDGVRVLGGPYAGVDFICEADGVPDAVGAFTNVSLIEDRVGDIAASLP